MSRPPSFFAHISDDVEDLVPIESVDGTNRRTSSRSIELHPCAVQSSSRFAAATITNLSTEGAELEWAECYRPNLNETLTLKLLGKINIEAQVVRVNGNRVAVQFSQKFASLDDIVMKEHLGRDFFCEALRLQKLSQ